LSVSSKPGNRPQRETRTESDSNINIEIGTDITARDESTSSSRCNDPLPSHLGLPDYLLDYSDTDAHPIARSTSKHFPLPAGCRNNRYAGTMTNVMDAWPSGATLSGPSQATPDAAKRVLHCVGLQPRDTLSAEEEARGIARHDRIALGA
jgi:hypothetical protein